MLAKDQAPAAAYWLTRFVLLRFLGLVYLVAFLVAAHQLVPLVGERGITPIGPGLERFEQQEGGPWKAASKLPTVFLWNHSDAWLRGVAWTGVALSAVVLLGFANVPIMLVLWVLYLSISHAGGLWYGYGWDMQLPETGFLGILLCPWLDPRPFARRAPPVIVIWLYRWLIFRMMIGAFLIKWRGDESWRDYTAMLYHYETQPVPNPLSRYLHFAPVWIHQFEVWWNHFVEAIVPVFIFLPALPLQNDASRKWGVGNRAAVAVGAVMVIIGLAIWQIWFKSPAMDLGFVTEPGSAWLLCLMAAGGLAGCLVPIRGAFVAGAAAVVGLFFYWQSQYPPSESLKSPAPPWLLYFVAVVVLICCAIPARKRSMVAAMGVVGLSLYCGTYYLNSEGRGLPEPPDLRLLYFISVVALLTCVIPATKLGERPWMATGFRFARHTAGVLLVSFQFILIISGNLAFLNWLTIIPALACFDDTFWRRLLPAFITRRAERAASDELARRSRVLHRVAHWTQLTLVSAYAIFVAWISLEVVENLSSKQQLMNYAMGPVPTFYPVNSYGAFGTIGRIRDELIVEGTDNPVPDEAAEWKEYEFKVKPGDVMRRPAVFTPYHYRLDWQIWFAAMDVPGSREWMVSLIWHLLQNDPATLSLIAKNPFPDKPPRYIRVLRYRYTFASPGNRDGAWWVRERREIWLPPIALTNANVRGFLESAGWLPRE